MIFNADEIWNYKKTLYGYFVRTKKKPTFDIDDVIQELWLDLKDKTIEVDDENHVKGFLIKAAKYKTINMFYSNNYKSNYRERNTIELPNVTYEDLEKNEDSISDVLKDFPNQEMQFDLPIFDNLVDKEIRRFCKDHKLFKRLKTPGEIKQDKPALKAILKLEVHENLPRVNVFGNISITKKMKSKLKNEKGIIKEFLSDFRQSQQFKNILLIEKQIL